MAQDQDPTYLLYAACAKAIKGDSYSEFVAMALEKGDMSGFTEASTAPATEATESGLSRAAATISVITTDVASDTVQMNHEFTAAEAATITGMWAMDATATATVHGLEWCKFASSHAMASGDKVDGTLKAQFKLGS